MVPNLRRQRGANEHPGAGLFQTPPTASAHDHTRPEEGTVITGTVPLDYVLVPIPHTHHDRLTLSALIVQVFALRSQPELAREQRSRAVVQRIETRV